MNSSQDDFGVITAVFEHLELEAIPRALAVKSEIDSGATLNELDLLFIEECLDEVANLLHVIDRHPEFQVATTKMVVLCHDITRRAVENQVAGSASMPLERLHSKLSRWPS